MGRKRKADADVPAAVEEDEPVEDAPAAEEESAEDEDATDDNEDAGKDGAGDAPVVKRGRGRPPKAGGPAKPKAAVSVKSADGPKRGRGRPRKAGGSGAKPKSGKGRGRPKKSA
ncbi:high mobility group protein I-like isoform X2 [Lineus longissimus]|uniref:high mobility group protein I-like isoform X2 n=1 Tax=Lineus longissimus TaxID=88925 RepID=UPI002B4DCA51